MDVLGRHFRRKVPCTLTGDKSHGSCSACVHSARTTNRGVTGATGACRNISNRTEGVWRCTFDSPSRGTKTSQATVPDCQKNARSPPGIKVDVVLRCRDGKYLRGSEAVVRY